MIPYRQPHPSARFRAAAAPKPLTLLGSTPPQNKPQSSCLQARGQGCRLKATVTTCMRRRHCRCRPPRPPRWRSRAARQTLWPATAAACPLARPTSLPAAGHTQLKCHLQQRGTLPCSLSCLPQLLAALWAMLCVGQHYDSRCWGQIPTISKTVSPFQKGRHLP